MRGRKGRELTGCSGFDFLLVVVGQVLEHEETAWSQYLG